jgi:hypothetical protein
MSVLLGMNAKLYLGDAVMQAASASEVLATTWTECSNATDVTLNLETGQADITTRGNNGWRATMATLKDGSIEFQMNWDPDDANFSAVQTAWTNSAAIAVLALDQANTVVGTQGLAGNFVVTNFTRTEPLEEAIKASVTLKPSSHNFWYERAS